ncbi:hypothetical protein DY000_02002454 [Brassica cretica]|uniref:Subtilisin-like protease fibronectin type-III domain-containing protein n=1 Tax=Brassica cretica TaxID=69181 RepID=A0ABQ7BYN2_BRACR|nr:hypothetical protein DY000_02002454 [Brassica cretica]
MTYNDINPGMIIPYRIKVDLIVNVPVLGEPYIAVVEIPDAGTISVVRPAFRSLSTGSSISLGCRIVYPWGIRLLLSFVMVQKAFTYLDEMRLDDERISLH